MEPPEEWAIFWILFFMRHPPKKTKRVRGKKDRKTLQGLKTPHPEALDPLTQIYTTDVFLQLLTEQLSKASESKEPVALILCRVIPNDSPYLPHDRSELESQLFRELVGLLKKNIRQTDTLARLSHYEFAVLLPKTNADRAQHFMERIQTVLQKSETLRRFFYQVEVKMAPCPPEAYPLMHLICPSAERPVPIFQDVLVKK